MQELESNIAPAVRRAGAAPQVAGIQSEDRQSLILFLSLMTLRTAASYETFERSSEEMMRHVLQDVPGTDDLSSLRNLKVADMNEHIFNLLPGVFLNLLDLEIGYVDFDENCLVTSDDPLVFTNPFLDTMVSHVSNTGLVTKGLICFIPLNAKRALVAYDGNVYRPQLGGLIMQQGLPASNIFNKIMCANAGRVVFYDPRTHLSLVDTAARRGARYRTRGRHQVGVHPLIKPDGQVAEVIQMSRWSPRTGDMIPGLEIRRSARNAEIDKEASVHYRSPEYHRRLHQASRADGKGVSIERVLFELRKRNGLDA